VLLTIILLGSIAVMVSYVYPVATQPQHVEPAWGGVTSEIRKSCTLGMLIAASGFFCYAYFLVFRPPDGGA
jgi:hypothetical protein